MTEIDVSRLPCQYPFEPCTCKGRVTDPDAQEIERYITDHETVARHRFPLRVIETLEVKKADERWHRERLCDTCEGWTPKQGADKRPIRPGNPHPTEGCKGCWYAMLDQGADYRPPAPETPRPRTRPAWRRVVSYLGPDQIRFTKGKGLQIDSVPLHVL